MAAQQCSQLAQALHEMLAQISMEDAANAAEPILQCLANVFTVRFPEIDTARPLG